MKLLTQNQASKLPYAPSVQAINKKLKAVHVPGFFVKHNGHAMVDIEHEDWEAMIEKRKDRMLRGAQPGVTLKNRKKINTEFKNNMAAEVTPDVPDHLPQSKPSAPLKPEYDDILEQAQIAKMMEPILKSQELEQKVEMRKLQLKKQASELIEYQLAEFLFFGYLERINMELLGITKKLAPTIDNLVKEKKPDAILKLLDREFEKMLIEAKTAQKEDVRKWKEEK
jgi:hypothetical protein